MNNHIALIDTAAKPVSTGRDGEGTPSYDRGGQGGWSTALPASVGLRAETSDGYAGEVSRLLLDPQSHLITHLVIRTRHFFGRDLLVPVGRLARVSPEAILLDMTRAELAHLPECRPDDEVAAGVERALWDDGVLHPLAIIRPEVRGGVVTLRGHVANGLHRDRAEAAVWRVTGVIALRDQLVADDELRVAAALAVGQAPRTRPYPIRVEVYQGIVHLTGRVPSKEVEMAAEEAASAVPGVRSVVAQLRPAESLAPRPPIILPRIGGPVFARDGEIGPLEGVVLDHPSRRVTHMIVSCSLLRPAEDGREWPRRVIPAWAVSVVTNAGVFLTIDRAEAAAMPVYHEEHYVAPESEWRPSFDYRGEDVRLVPDRLEVGHDARLPQVA